MEVYGRVDVEIRVFLTSAVVEGEYSASRSGSFTPEKLPWVPIAFKLRSKWCIWPYIMPQNKMDNKKLWVLHLSLLV
jgi:hypothetical protein